ncbi:MAG: cobyric acid synthase [Calditerrivibrio sp.]|nr:cobyric acid synthase [Calditerrivibrio sp.]
MPKNKSCIFIGGTSSGAGKSLVVTALCRIFKQDGLTPAPFKAQNMSLNSYVTYDGLEMARAQVLQAEAAYLEPSVDMNPILIKPFGDSRSQLIIRGKSNKNITSRDLYDHELNKLLWEHVVQSFSLLSNKYFPVVIEGAGSISELNLKQKDIVNINLAKFTKADTYLVSNIEQGGIFASCFGSIKLLPKKEQNLVKGIIVNKFRGDISLFEEGKEILEKITGKKVLGILPYIKEIHLDDEDSLSLEYRRFENKRLKIAVIRLPYISNFTDFKTLSLLKEVSLIFTNQLSDLDDAGIIILPGTKSTTKDMKFLWDSGLAYGILDQYKKGKTIIGVCGGFQMMGNQILDPHKLEGNIEKIEGLNILPIKTVLEKEKITRRIDFIFNGTLCYGYEIHVGRTEYYGGDDFAVTRTGERLGCKIDNRCFGTYIHGLFDNRIILEHLLSPFGIDISHEHIYPERKEHYLNILADTVRNNLNMKEIYKNLGL